MYLRGTDRVWLYQVCCWTGYLISVSEFQKAFWYPTDSLDYQLEAVISQYEKPIDFYSRKLTGPQTRYTVTENKWLSIVERWKEFCTVLLGQQLNIYTNHNNLTCKTLVPIAYYCGDLYYKNTARILSKSQAIKTYLQTHYHD